MRIPLDVLREHAPEVAKVMAWVDGPFYEVDLAPARRAHPGVMDLDAWLAGPGRERLLAQL